MPQEIRGVEPLFRNFGRHFVGCAVLYALIAVLVLVIFLVARSAGVSFFEMTKDPYAGSADTIPVYTSILSHTGIMLWCFTAAIQVFAAWIVRRQDAGSRAAAFLFWSGCITLFLMLDDFLMLHERMSHGVETVVFGTYGVVVGIVLVVYRDVIFRTNYLVLATALGCFGMSMVLDNILTQLSIDIPYRTTLEDAFKLIGIVGWSYYFISLAVRAVGDGLSDESRIS